MFHTLIQTLTDGIAVGSLYALIALGYTLVFGILQFINFAHGDVFALGALLTATIAGWLATHLNPGWANPLLFAVVVPIAAIGICALVGFCIERFAYRPLRSAPRLNVLITAIGVSLLMENTGQLKWAFSTRPTAVPTLIKDHIIATLRNKDPNQNVQFHLVDLIVLSVALALMMGLQLIVYRTRFGTAMRAVSFNARAAALMGINVDRVISITFVIGSALAGAAGYLFAVKYQTGTLNQPADALWILLGMKAFVAAVVGGIGNIRGAMLGGLMIGLVEHFGASAGGLGQQLGWWHNSVDTAQFKDVFVFLLLILVLLVRPAGLLGKAAVEKGMSDSRTATLFTDPPSVKPPLWLTPFRALWPMALAILAAGFAFFVLAPHLNPYQQDVVSKCGIAIILAVSLTVVNGFTGQFSIGHSGFMSLGGYAAASLMFYGSSRWLGDTESHGGILSGMTGHWFTHGDLLFLLSLLCGGTVAAIIGLVVGLPSLRLRGDYLAIVTLGFCEIVRVVIQSTPDQLGPKPTDPDDIDPSMQYLGSKPLVTELHHLGGALGFSGAPTYTTVFWIGFFALLTLALTIRLKYSSYGRAMLSIREDDIAAQAVGVNITKLKVRAFVFSAFFAGLAGGLFALKDGTINAGELGFQRSFDFVIMVVLGGMGSISGAAIAAIILTLLPEWLRGLDSYRMVIFSLLLIVMMIVRPQGLFGIREIWDYLPVKWQWWNRPLQIED